MLGAGRRLAALPVMQSVNLPIHLPERQLLSNGGGVLCAGQLPSDHMRCCDPAQCCHDTSFPRPRPLPQNAAYSDGCREPPAQCWVPESNETRTCVMSLTCMNPNNDPSKIFASEDVCCSRVSRMAGAARRTLTSLGDVRVGIARCRHVRRTWCGRRVAARRKRRPGPRREGSRAGCEALSTRPSAAGLPTHCARRGAGARPGVAQCAPLPLRCHPARLWLPCLPEGHHGHGHLPDGGRLLRAGRGLLRRMRPPPAHDLLDRG